MKKEQKEEYRNAIKKKCVDAGMKVITTSPHEHHMLYEVEKLENKLKETEDLD